MCIPLYSPPQLATVVYIYSTKFIASLFHFIGLKLHIEYISTTIPILRMFKIEIVLLCQSKVHSCTSLAVTIFTYSNR